QQQKTSILDAVKFSEHYLSTPLDREMDSLHEKFQELIEGLGLDNWYEEIDYDDLDESQKKIVDTLNLVDLFQQEVKSNNPDIPVLRFCLRRLGQLGDDGAVEIIFKNLESITPAFVDVINYLLNLRY